VAKFDGKTIIVTGGAGALGAAVVEKLIAEGGRCVVPVRGKFDPKQAYKNVEYVEGIDLTDEAAVERFYAKVGKLWGSVHAAGTFSMGKVETIKKTDFVNMMQVNLLSAFLCSREAVKGMRAGGIGGRIVNVAARAAVEPRIAGMLPYVVSKAAVGAMTISLAEEVKNDGIYVNAVLPSVMDTPANRKDFPTGTDYSKWASVQDVASVIVFLLSEENRVTSGALVPVYAKA
jgi:NAD(P)-dependent dehydrogenase (short-subunit alcohol dehydrogenase family)